MVLGFDRPYAHPVGSFQEPVTPPTVEPDEGELTQVCFAVAWLPYVQGALTQLLLQSTWIGTPDEIALAQGRATNLRSLFDVTLCPMEVPTPYWDEDSEVDDEAAPEDQIWYGEVSDPTVCPTELTFIENAAIWAFTGLLAVAGAAPAAIAFHTIAPKMILSVRQGNLGNIIRIFIDGEQAAQQTDTGDNSVVDIPIICDPAIDTHQLYLTVEAV